MSEENKNIAIVHLLNNIGLEEELYSIKELGYMLNEEDYEVNESLKEEFDEVMEKRIRDEENHADEVSELVNNFEENEKFDSLNKGEAKLLNDLIGSLIDELTGISIYEVAEQLVTDEDTKKELKDIKSDEIQHKKELIKIIEKILDINIDV